MIIFDILSVVLFNLITFTAYLGFSVNRTYYQYFCKCIDMKCKEICETLAKQKLNETDNKAVTLTLGTFDIDDTDAEDM